MPTGLYTRWDLNSETGRFTPRQKKTRRFENMLMSYFQRSRLECKTESFFTTSRQKKIDCFHVDGFCSHCNTVFEAMGCYYHFSPCQKVRPSLTEEDIQHCSKKRELDPVRRQHIQEKSFNVIEMWESKWSRLYKTTNTVKQNIREHFPDRRSLAAEHSLEERWKRESYLVTCSAILKYMKIWDQKLITCLQYSRTPYAARMISGLDEKICRWRKIIVSTSENVDI